MTRSLVPVTQLYVSVDASTKDSLKKIDRPLFKDFWPRFLDSLRALGEKVSCPLRWSQEWKKQIYDHNHATLHKEHHAKQVLL